MKITFLHYDRFSDDNFIVRAGHEGETLDVGHTAATGCMQRGSAVSAEPKLTEAECIAQILSDLKKLRDATRRAA